LCDAASRPWEAGQPADDGEDSAAVTDEHSVPPGIPEHVQEQLIRNTAEKIKSRGSQPGSVWGQFAESILNPKVDPRVLLMRAVRKAIEQIPGGNGEWTYRRPSRRPGTGGIVRPSAVQLVPKITVVVDSSGSMDADDIGLALGLIGKVLNCLRLRDGVRVIVETQPFKPPPESSTPSMWRSPAAGDRHER
jgi:predicted metal-dependent peptidase